MVSNSQSEPTLLKLGDLADRWSISRQHVYRLKNRGEIPFIKIGAGYYVNLEQIKEIEQGQVGTCEDNQDSGEEARKETGTSGSDRIKWSRQEHQITRGLLTS